MKFKRDRKIRNKAELTRLQPPRAALCAILAVPGFIGWILPYFCYRAIRRRKTNRLSPLIEKKYDELYDVCEKANGLLGGE